MNSQDYFSLGENVMKLIGNVIWFLIYGLWMAAVHFVIGVAFCATVIFIPTGLQFIKIARYAIWPFGHSAVTDFDRHPICNLLWIPLFGWWLSLIHLLVGIVLCITLIGIPFAKKCFRLCALSFLPYGATVA